MSTNASASAKDRPWHTVGTQQACRVAARISTRHRSDRAPEWVCVFSLTYATATRNGKERWQIGSLRLLPARVCPCLGAEPRRHQGSRPHTAVTVLSLLAVNMLGPFVPPSRGGLLPGGRSPWETPRAMHGVWAEAQQAAGPARPSCPPGPAPGIGSGRGRALLPDPWLLTPMTLGYKEGRHVKTAPKWQEADLDSPRWKSPQIDPRLGFIHCL